MEITEAIMERMDQYLFDIMSSEEKKEFEADLASDPGLREAFDAHKSMIFSVEAAGVKDDLSKIIANQKSQKSSAKTISFNRTWIAVAASVVILVGAFYLFNTTRSTAGGELYAEFYTVDPGLPTLMGTSDDPRFAEAMVKYKQGEYRTALAEFDLMMNDHNSNDTLLFYRGLCHLELDQPEVSINLFDQIDPVSSIWAPKAQWYQAMAHLRQDNLDEAKTMINQIVQNPNHRFYQSAKALQNRL